MDNKYSKIKKSKGTPMLSKESVVDMNLGILVDKEGKQYQAQFNPQGTFMGLKRITKRRHEK